jgi:integrating conjugative element membrane protein (TIGR03745 family)
MKILRFVKKKFGALRAMLFAGSVMVANTASAALPDPADPTNAAADGDYIGLLKGYAFDIFIVIGLVLSTLAFIVVSKNMIATYNEIGAGKKTWGDMGMHGGMGVLLLVFTVYLLTEAAGIIF